MCAALAIAVLFYQQASQMGPVINGLVMATIGLLVAGPDALLGSSSIADTCEAAGYGGEVLGTASGLVNGAGSVGAVLQGALTAWIASTYGWGALFGTLAVMCVLSVGTLLLSVPEVSKVGGRGRLKTAVA
jgi:sugar phosphate permease|tara:strand:- start:90 stop:482 length:393 start_codon:yes stop_codon:yes gene_type:complete